MIRKAGVYGIVLGLASLVGCAGDTPGPTSIDVPVASTPAPVPVPTVPAAPADPGSASLVGSHSMTVEIGPECAAVPAAERRRDYAVTLEPHRDGALLATLTGATFLGGPICTAGSGRFAGVGCDQFFVSTSGGDVTIALENNNDEAHGGHITERTRSGEWLAIIGTATGRQRGSAIAAAGTASVWYCPVASDYPFPCRTFTGCQATMQVTLTRR